MSVSLLVDARNALYRAIYAVKAERRTVKYHYFAVFLRLLSSWINKYRPDSVHIFWDAARQTVWRKQILATYKDRSSSQYVEDISEDLAITTNVAEEFFKVMGVRQYYRDKMEADDLLYAAVSVLHPQKTIVVSTDSDMIQIPYVFSSSTVYNPKKKLEIELPKCNPVWLKALEGDDADSIGGYYGIGPVKGTALAQDPQALFDFLAIKGDRKFKINLMLIDLSLCPKLFKNRIYVMKQLAKNVVFDEKAINKLIHKHKVNGMLQEYSDIIPHFKHLK